MPDTKKKHIAQFSGLLFRVDEFSSSELGHYLQLYQDRAHKLPTHMLVNPKLDLNTVHLPEQYKDVEVQVKQYIHHPNVVMIGVWL